MPLTTETNGIQNAFLGFAGIVTAAAAWSIWGGDMFPAANDPKGGEHFWVALRKLSPLIAGDRAGDMGRC